MKISQRVTYGILATVDLALNANGAPIQARTIARRQGMPVRFLEQVLNALKKAGLVESVRGAFGGYRLVGKPADLTVAQIVEALDGPVFHPLLSLHDKQDKQAGKREALLDDVWQQVRQAEQRVLQRITVQHLAERQRALDAQLTPMYHI